MARSLLPALIIAVYGNLRNATVARLMLLQAHGGRIRAIVEIEAPMSGFMEDRDHGPVSQAEDRAIATAEQRRASVLIIEDRT